MSLWNYLMKGGPVMYVLLPLSAISLTIMIEKMLFLRKENASSIRLMNTLRDSMSPRKELSELQTAFSDSSGSSFFPDRIFPLLLDRTLSDAQMGSMLETETLLYEKRLKEKMWILDTTVTMAPLLGLLGTIIGIISSFHVMSVSGLGKPAQITGGVAEALIATATGLVIAIVSLFFYNFLNAIIREIRVTLESSIRLLVQMRTWGPPLPVRGGVADDITLLEYRPGSAFP